VWGLHSENKKAFSNDLHLLLVKLKQSNYNLPSGEDYDGQASGFPESDPLFCFVNEASGSASGNLMISGEVACRKLERI
jgi:hypothetical protein